MLPFHHQFSGVAQTHVHQVSDPIQSSHLLSSPSPPAFSLSSIRVFYNESVLCIRWPKCQSFSFSISPSNKYSELISLMIDLSLQSKGLSRVFSTTTVQNNQFFSAQLSLWSNSHISTNSDTSFQLFLSFDVLSFPGGSDG